MMTGEPIVMAISFCTNHKKVPAKFRCRNCKKLFCSACVERMGVDFVCKGCLNRISTNLEKGVGDAKKTSILLSALHLILSFISAGAVVFGIVCFVSTVAVMTSNGGMPHAWVLFYDGVILDRVFTTLLNFVISVILISQGWGLLVRKRIFFWSGMAIALAYFVFFALSAVGLLGAISVSRPAGSFPFDAVGALLAFVIIIANRHDFF